MIAPDLSKPARLMVSKRVDSSASFEASNETGRARKISASYHILNPNPLNPKSSNPTQPKPQRNETP